MMITTSPQIAPSPYAFASTPVVVVPWLSPCLCAASFLRRALLLDLLQHRTIDRTKTTTAATGTPTTNPINWSIPLRELSSSVCVCCGRAVVGNGQSPPVQGVWQSGAQVLVLVGFTLTTS